MKTEMANFENIIYCFGLKTILEKVAKEGKSPVRTKTIYIQNLCNE